MGAADDENVANVMFDLTRKYHEAGASIETHIYTQGKHAFNMGQRSPYVSIRHWPDRWLTGCRTADTCAPHPDMPFSRSPAAYSILASSWR